MNSFHSPSSSNWGIPQRLRCRPGQLSKTCAFSFLIYLFIDLLLLQSSRMQGLWVFTCTCCFTFVKMGVALTFLLTALLQRFALFALFAFVLAAELHDANDEEDCQNPKADQHAHRFRVHRAPCEWGWFNYGRQLKHSIRITHTAISRGILLPMQTTRRAISSIRLPDLNWINKSVCRKEGLALMTGRSMWEWCWLLTLMRLKTHCNSLHFVAG